MTKSDKKHKKQQEWRRIIGVIWPKRRWQKIVVIIATILIIIFGVMYGIALWYQHSVNNQPLDLGVTFIADYASSLGVDPHKTFDTILNDLHPKQVRLVSYWSDIESTKGKYDFSELDWEMQQAQQHHVKVTLAIGLRQPRWPECHAPSWADTSKPIAQWQPELEQFMTKTITRYRNNPALESYQLENEYYNHFGGCNDYSRSRLSDELALTKKLDPKHEVIMSRSNNYVGLMLRKPLPDVIGISVYRHVWTPVTHSYFTYPYPSWYYAFLAGAEKIATGKPAVIHELQEEPWPPHGQSITDTSLAEQNKSFNAKIFNQNLKFAEQTGIKHIDLWGAEYWYYRDVTLHDPSVWKAAEKAFNE